MGTTQEADSDLKERVDFEKDSEKEKKGFGNGSVGVQCDKAGDNKVAQCVEGDEDSYGKKKQRDGAKQAIEELQ